MKTKYSSTSVRPTAYAPLLADLKARVRAAQVKAAVAVKMPNREFAQKNSTSGPRSSASLSQGLG